MLCGIAAPINSARIGGLMGGSAFKFHAKKFL